MKVVSYVVVLVSLVACNPGEGQGRGRVNDNVVPTTPAVEISAESSCRVSASESPFSCVAKKCQVAGGTYLPLLHSCDCGVGKTFIGWGEGSCRNSPIQNKCLKSKWGFYYAKKESDEKLVDCLTLHSDDRTSVQLTGLMDNGDLQSVVNWADDKLPKSFEAIRRQPALFQLLSVNWFVGPGTLDALDEVNLIRMTTPFTILLSPPRESTPVNLYYHFDKSDDLNAIFTPAEDNSTVEVEQPQDAQLSSVYAGLKTALGRIFHVDEKQYFTEDGCAGHCELRQRIVENGVNTTRSRVYVGGVLFTDQILVWEDTRQERAKALAQLLPSGQISLIHVFDRQLEAQNLSLKYQVYDRHWSPLLSRPRSRIVVKGVGDFLDTVKKIPGPSFNAPHAILCESGFDLETLKTLGTDTFALGPSEKSVFGWVDSQQVATNPIDLIGQFSLSGISEFTSTGSRLAFVSYSDHAIKVGHKLTWDWGDIKILPIGFSACAEQSQRWLPQVKSSSKAKVLNFSAALSYTRGACEASAFGKQIRAQENEMLYVVAAGNDALNGDAQAIPTCPQGLNGSPNLIVVAAGMRDSLAPSSNYGIRFSDIIADGSHYEEGQQSYTTSLAAPLVTRKAALISWEFPKLNPKQIRKAILLGAKIPVRGRHFSPLPVRSGGWLNSEMASHFARAMDENPALSDRELIRKIYCESSVRENCSLVPERIQILEARNLLESK